VGEEGGQNEVRGMFFFFGGGGAILRIRLKIENAGDGNTCSQLQAELYIKLNRYSEVV